MMIQQKMQKIFDDYTVQIFENNELYMKLKEARKMANIDLLILNLIAVAEHSFN